MNTDAIPGPTSAHSPSSAPGPSSAATADGAVQVAEITQREVWDSLVLTHGGHPLQLWGWGQVKASGQWTARRLRITDQGQVIGLAQVLVRQLPFPFKALSYVPRGPLVVVAKDVVGDGDYPQGSVAYGVGEPEARVTVMEAISRWCRDYVGGIGVSFEPDWPQDTSADLPGARPGRHTILYPHTLIVDLGLDDSQLMAAMTKKTRQYIRKSSREGLTFRQVTSDQDVQACLDIYASTAQRAGFGIHTQQYYQLVRSQLGQHSPIFAAFTDQGTAVSFVWFAASDTTAFELYGGMTQLGQDLRANYGLKWFAMQQLRERGVRRYDVNGLLNDGISTFKRGFASHEDHLVGTIDIPFNPLYGLWTRALPQGIAAVRKLGTLRQRRTADGQA